MAKGGKRAGAGRPKGSSDKAKIAAEIAASGLTPLDYMLETMRDPLVEYSRRDDMAKAAAPYCHPKLSAIEHTGKDGGPIQTEDVSDKELARRVALLLVREGSK